VNSSNSPRTSFFTILLISILTLGIGGYSAIHTKNAETSEVNASLNFVAQASIDNPKQSVGAALFAIEQLTLNITLTLLTRQGRETLINESSLQYLGAPEFEKVREATLRPVRVGGPSPYQLRAVAISGGDFILIARSISVIDEHFRSNIRSLAAFTVVVDSLAGLLLFFYFRRVNLRNDVASLARMQEFLGDASHELRTPLTVVKGYVEMLSKNQLASEDDQRRAFSRVGSEITRMENLIQDLLLLAELGESGSRDIEKIDIGEILKAHSTDFKVLNPEREVTLEIETDMYVLASRDYLARFIQNALTNIMRHTDRKDAVLISCKKSGKTAKLIIGDAGPGLPESAYQENIRSLARFDKSRSRENGGSGLGMSIMSAVISKLHGNFALRKSELGGLEIAVDLPLVKE
jgi:two-component system, OmpR family, sensor kinase